jgi:hypothetical protein
VYRDPITREPIPETWEEEQELKVRAVLDVPSREEEASRTKEASRTPLRAKERLTSSEYDSLPIAQPRVTSTVADTDLSSLLPPPPPGSPQWKGYEPRIAASEELVALLLELLEVSDYAGLSQPFTCPIHGGDQRSAQVWRPESGDLLIVDHHLPKSGTMTMGQFYGSALRKRVIELGPPGHAIWLRRILVDTGLVPPSPILWPPLPAGASRRARRVYDAIQHLFGVRWLREHAPAPLTWTFINDWSGIGPRQVGEGRQELLTLKLIEPAGKHGRTNLFLPYRHQPNDES